MLAFERFASSAAFATGAVSGAELASGGDGITLGPAERGTWTGPWVDPGFAFDRLVASWNADTPPGTLLTVEVQCRTGDGSETGWYVLGLWTLDDGAFGRASRDGQADEHGEVAVDTLVARQPLASYRLRLLLNGAEGAAPSVRMVGAIASAGTQTLSAGRQPSEPGLARAVELPVPPYSQAIHRGEYPQYDGGGASWCSPASTSMVVAFWGEGPTPADMGWVDPSLADPCVDHAARFTFDHAFGGAGNWPFNTAYAASFGLDAFVTRLRSLREAELFVEAGVPLVASIAARPGQLDGFPLPEGTRGHLVVIAGFTEAGDPIVNDPAAPSNETVRRVYDRAQFEQAWLGGSGGVVYVISRPGVALPPSPGNW